MKWFKMNGDFKVSKIVLVTGGFDPLHSGHIAYFREAKKLGDRLIVGVNSDAWLTRKKGRPFMPVWERTEIIQNLKIVDQVVFFDDGADRDGSAKHFIRETLELFPNDEIIFANGGDRTQTNIPEMEIQDARLSFAFGVGGEHKQNSSSWILTEWKSPKTNRAWGYYRVLHEVGTETKVKELTVEPGQSLSMQKHKERAEYWFVAEGTATLYTLNTTKTDEEFVGEFKKHSHIFIYEEQWHQLRNETDQPLKVIEVQYGKNCIEGDIERL
jgi:cytidyltransferase-like protein